MKIIAVGMNYAQHNKELGHTQVNTEPVIFMKPDSAILKVANRFSFPTFLKRYIMKRSWWFVLIDWGKI